MESSGQFPHGIASTLTWICNVSFKVQYNNKKFLLQVFRATAFNKQGVMY